MQRCGLSEVIFLPERKPRGKRGVTEIAHRMALLRVGLDGHQGLRAARLRSQQFSVRQTLPELRQLGRGAKLTLLIGSDIVPGLPHWPDITDLLEDVTLAIGLRAGTGEGEIQSCLQDLSQALAMPIRHMYVRTSMPHIASSQIRQGSTQTLPAPMLEYITANKLYRRA